MSKKVEELEIGDKVNNKEVDDIVFYQDSSKPWTIYFTDGSSDMYSNGEIPDGEV